MKFYTSVTRHSSKILHRGYENGKQFKEAVQYRPFVFMPSKDKNTKYQTLNGTPVEEKRFDSLWEQSQWMKQYKDVEGFNYYGSTNSITTFIYENYHGEVKFDTSLIRVAIIDIECDGLINGDDFIETAPSAITTISLKIGNKIIAFGLKDFKAPNHVKYFKCKDEQTMLKTFLTIWEGIKPDVVSGWNIVGFDIPYLISRIRRLFNEEEINRLSPWNKVNRREFFDRYSMKVTYEIEGIAILDYLDLYKKFTLQVHGQLESYSLNYVCYFELGENKIDYSEFGSLPELYEKNFQRYMEYNIHDVQLIQNLDDKLKFFDLVYEVAYIAKCNYQDVLKTIPVWESLIHAYLMDRRIVVPIRKQVSETMTIPGGFVKEPILGLHEWVVSFDVASLYPHLIMQYNLSPETLLGKKPIPTIERLLDGANLDTDGHSVAATGCHYTRDKAGFLPILMREIFDRRSIFKKEMLAAQKLDEKSPSEETKKQVASLKAKQQAYKILANSGYGALCNIYFTFFSYDLAMSITLGGQLSIKWVAKEVNAYLNKVLNTENRDYIVAIDTDSIYVTLGDLVRKAMPGVKDKTMITNFLDEYSEKKIQKVIDKAFLDLATKMNAFDPCLKMKRESIAIKGIWTGKKRYVLNVFDNEGVRYKEPKLKFTGLEVVRSSVPEICRDALKEAINIIMNQGNDELIKYIDDFKKKYKKMNFYEVSCPTGMNGINEYYDSVHLVKPKCPIHVRGAIIYNEWVKNNNFQNKYPLIKEGEKIKYCYLKLPNRLKSDVVAISTQMPEEMELPKYIDYETQFEKKFMKPLESILGKINWQSERINTLDELF